MSTTEEKPQVIEVRLPGLHGPVHDWIVIPLWLDEKMHAEGVEHEHRRGQGR